MGGGDLRGKTSKGAFLWTGCTAPVGGLTSCWDWRELREQSDNGGPWLWLRFSHVHTTQSCPGAWVWAMDQRPGASRWIGWGLEQCWLLPAAALGLSCPLLTRMLGHVLAHRVLPSTGLAMDNIGSLLKFAC